MAIELHHLHPSHDDEVARLKSRIAELEEERRWRKFPDEKPTEDTLVLVFVETQSLRLISLDVYTRKEDCVTQFKAFGDYATHWMPLPKEPKEGK